MLTEMKNWMIAGMLLAAVMGTGRQANATNLELQRSVYGSFYLGPDFTSSSDVSGDNTVPPFMPVTLHDVSYKTGLTVGGRLGYWHNTYWGGALDIFSYNATTKSQTVEVSAGGFSGEDSIDDGDVKYHATVLAFNLMVRYPITENLFPYVGVGPAIYMNNIHSQVTGEDDSATNLGFSLPVGIQYNVLTQENIVLGLFSELKFTYDPTKVSVMGSDVTNKLFTTHLLFGLTLAYNL